MIDQFYDADLRDVQVLLSFNEELVEQVIKGDAIDFTQIKKIEDINSPDYLNNFIISTAAQDSLVNFQYSVFNNGSDVNGSIELIDNNDIFFDFVSQSIARGEYFSLYIAWGYGKNRLHWSLVHRVLITDINYNIHEGHKVVNIHFAPLLEMRNDRGEISNIYTPLKEASKLKFKLSTNPITGKPIPIENRNVVVETRSREKEIVLTDIIEKAAKACFSRGLYGDTSITVDSKGIQDALAASNWVRKRQTGRKKNDNLKADTFSDTDKFWQIFCSEIGCLDYQRSLGPASFSTTTAPGSEGHKLDHILPKGIELKKYEDDVKRIVTNIRKYHYGKPYDPTSKLKITTKILDKLYNNLTFDNDTYSIITFYKPQGDSPIPYFNRFLNALNTRLGLNLKFFISDASRKPKVLIGQDILKLGGKEDLIKSNINKKLFHPGTGLRKIRSINPKGKTLLEDMYDGTLNLTYNDRNSIIEKATVDINLPELFAWSNKLFHFDKLSIKDDDVFSLFYLSDLLTVTNSIKRYLSTFAYNHDNKSLDQFIKMVSDTANETKGERSRSSVCINIQKELLDDVVDYIKRNRLLISQAIAKDFISLEMRLLRMTVAMPGIPEIDEMNNLYFGRRVKLTVNDPSITKDGPNQMKLVSGIYFIEGFRHEILIGEGYQTYLTLFKAIDETMFPTGERGDL